MRRVPLRIISVSSNETCRIHGFELDYRQEFLAVVSSFPDGLPLHEMAKYRSLNQKLINSKFQGRFSVVDLDDHEHELLLSRLKTATFKFYAEELFEMLEAVEGAETLPAAEPQTDKAYAQPLPR